MRICARFSTEEKALKTLLKLFGKENIFPKVTAIGGKKIKSSIDILKIEKSKSDEYELTGYKVKILKFDKRSKELSLTEFYKGIGQALMMLLYGINRVFLILCFHENVPSDDNIMEFYCWLRSRKYDISGILGKYCGLGILLHENYLDELIMPLEKFYGGSKWESFRNALIEGNFTYDKRLKRRL